MAVEIRVPTLGESVTEASVGQWLKKVGEAVRVDEPLVELETDKVSVEVSSPAAGALSEIAVKEGDTVEIGALLGAIVEGEAAAANGRTTGAAAGATPASEKHADEALREEAAAAVAAISAIAEDMPPSPSAAKLMAENDLRKRDLVGSGRRGQILKEDVLLVIEGEAPAPAPTQAPTTAQAPAPQPVTRQPARQGTRADAPREERVRMTRLRQTIARRLKDAQNSAAMLTTFNEVDMSAVMDLRREYKDLFLKKHGVKLGFMGFFVKAVVSALREIPEVNAEIDETDLIYKNYYNIGVAVGAPSGLVVPVVRDADQLSLAGVESAIGALAAKARDGDLSMEEMMGGTFTITNGGVYGSLMSTPILNAPQSGILGMHKIEQRPVVVNGEIVARPMMYLALSYDHRIVDGQQAVSFLVRVRENIEDPKRLILEL